MIVFIRIILKYVRSKILVYDSWFGVVYVGFIGIVILCVFFGFIVLLDFFIVFCYFNLIMESKCNVNIFKKCKLFKNYV